MKTQALGNRKPPQAPAELHSLGAKPAGEAQAISADRLRGFVVQFHIWAELEEWKRKMQIERARRFLAQ